MTNLEPVNALAFRFQLSGSWDRRFTGVTRLARRQKPVTANSLR